MPIYDKDKNNIPGVCLAALFASAAYQERKSRDCFLPERTGESKDPGKIHNCNSITIP